MHLVIENLISIAYRVYEVELHDLKLLNLYTVIKCFPSYDILYGSKYMLLQLFGMHPFIMLYYILLNKFQT